MPAAHTIMLMEDRQPLQQLPRNRGGYYYLAVGAKQVEQFPRQKKVRLQCVIDQTIILPCGLNPLGDGNYFIIVATRHVKALKKKPGEVVHFRLYEDPNPLGVAVPEVLEALLQHDHELKTVYDNMTDGKKRSLIFLISGIKNVDTQVQKTLQFLTAVKQKKLLYKRGAL